MTRKRKTHATSADDLASRFTIVGDPANLPDAFFDALASLLLDLAESDKTTETAKTKEHSSSRPAKSKTRQARTGDTAT